MAVLYEERTPDSPLVRTIWRTRAERDGCDIVTADSSWDMMLVRRADETTLTVWGPTTHAKPIPHLQGDECLGIRFTPGVYLRQFTMPSLLDRGIALPAATHTSFWLDGSSWQFPDYENADTFIDWLVRADALVRDPVVDAALHDQHADRDLSLRSIQRHFTQTTGLTHIAIRHIERAHSAAALLEQGVSILDTTYQMGYADQPHLTRSLKRLLGKTPAQLIGARKS